MILPMYNQFDDTWRIDNEDGTYSLRFPRFVRFRDDK